MPPRPRGFTYYVSSNCLSLNQLFHDAELLLTVQKGNYLDSLGFGILQLFHDHPPVHTDGACYIVRPNPRPVTLPCHQGFDVRIIVPLFSRIGPHARWSASSPSGVMEYNQLRKAFVPPNPYGSPPGLPATTPLSEPTPPPKPVLGSPFKPLHLNARSSIHF